MPVMSAVGASKVLNPICDLLADFDWCMIAGSHVAYNSFLFVTRFQQLLLCRVRVPDRAWETDQNSWKSALAHGTGQRGPVEPVWAPKVFSLARILSAGLAANTVGCKATTQVAYDKMSQVVGHGPELLGFPAHDG